MTWLLVINLLLTTSAPATEPIFVSPKTAQSLIKAGATVLDARGRRAAPPFLPGAQAIEWLRLRDGWFRTGRLDDDQDALRAALEERGVDHDRPVVVYGDVAQSWGEEGRIWWMLRYLGHRQVKIIDGGIAAWRRAGLPTVGDDPGRAQPGKFEVRTQPALRAPTSQVQTAIKNGLLILDVRTTEEFAGATPFLAARGGHIPGARHLHWRELVGKDHTLLPAAAIRERLRSLGAGPDTPIITYCTGGVRAAFAQAALLHAGFRQVANYDGSWWEWAAREELPVER